jgi:hypothetical protein
MSNHPSNREQDQLFQQTPTQADPSAAKPTDFKIEARDGGQRGPALLAEADSDGKRQLGTPIPDRNKVPSHEKIASPAPEVTLRDQCA